MRDSVYLRVIKGDKVSLIGSWEKANETIDNWGMQQDIGWHIFFALHDQADKVEVVYGDMENDPAYCKRVPQPAQEGD